MELLLVIAVLVLGASLWFVTTRWNEIRAALVELRTEYYQQCYMLRQSEELRQQAILNAEDYLAAHQGDYPQDE